MTGQDGTGGGKIELVAVTDPVEGAFTVSLPRGWQSQARSVRPYGVHRTVVNTRSPDGGTFLFFGDPQLPTYSEPSPQMLPGHPLAQVHPFVPAEPFFLGYVRQRHGQAPGFRLLGAAPCPALEQDVQRSAQRHGLQARPTAVSLSFELTDAGRRVRGRLHGTTFSTGAIWVADVFGVLTTDDLDPACWDDLLFGIARSLKTEPRWRQQQDQLHANRMAQIQQDHQRATAQMQLQHQGNMGWIQASMQGHQARMDALHASADAQLQGWYAQQAASDGAHQGFMSAVRGQGAGPGPDADPGHRRFVNAIRGEETVVDASGATYQVEAGHERYYRNRQDGTCIGTGGAVDREALRERFGVNPEDYEEVRIRR
jgi:hypothetical protein